MKEGNSISRTGGGYKWCVVAMLSCAFFFHQADRALFGLLTIPIQTDLGLTDSQIGWINTVLSWTLAAMTFVAGFAGDRLSRKWLITGSLIFWSVFDVVKPQHRSTVVGCMVMSAFFFGGLSGVAMGKLSDAYGIFGFEIGFATLGVAYLLGAGVMMISFFRTFTHDRIEE